MKYTTIEEISKLLEFIAAREDRINAITKRATEIARTAHGLSLEQLEAVTAEVADLRKELAEHKKFIRDAKLVIAKFYAPAIVA